MKRYFVWFFLLMFVVVYPETSKAQSSTYTSPDQLASWVQQMESSHAGVLKATNIATSPGDRSVYILQIGEKIGSPENTNPSVCVGANLEGDRPLSTEGAIFLTETILADPAQYDSLNWYILPMGNPDAAALFFEKPLYESSRNDLPTNDDRDDLTDEDGVNDLNGDGWITQMRVKHPDGSWITSDADARLMQEADPKKGQQGVFKIYTEGLDDDGDGKYNEDGPGGTNVGINFPQLFKHFTASGGMFPGSTPESYAVMKFVFEHPDIAMIVSLGSTNFCYTPPRGGRKGEADLNKIRLSERQARQFNLDASRTYSISELVDIIKAENPQMNVDESLIAGYLGLGAALNPQAGDLIFYEKYAELYKAYLTKQGVTKERMDPLPAKEGSFELWGYFQVGVPVFSLDLWAIDKPAEKEAKAKAGDKKGGGKKPAEKAPDINKALLYYSDSLIHKRGFVEWEPYDHPTLGSVEIGGFVPYLSSTPPYEWADSLMKLQMPWILKLAGELPDLHIYDVRVSTKGKGVYQLEIWIENTAFIPFPTHMGSRNMQPAPAVLTLEGEQVEFLSGYKRTAIPRVGGKSRIKTSFIIQMEKPGELKLNLESKTAGQDQTTINIGG